MGKMDLTCYIVGAASEVDKRQYVGQMAAKHEAVACEHEPEQWVQKDVIQFQDVRQQYKYAQARRRSDAAD